MKKEFSKEIYYGSIIKGDLIGAIRYVKQFPEQAGLYNRFMEVFEQEQYTTYDVDADLNAILTAYQQYYRDVFYLCLGKEQAADKLRTRLASLFGITGESITLWDLEQKQITQAFQSRGLYFLGGKSSGYYGPYVWRTTENVTYEVELPDGVQTYPVKLLDGFLTRSWIDFLSFGEIGPGGWADGDGIINCVKSSYDFDNENFKVSLLKHEAQHARDFERNKDMSSEDLEYRAKLVELIYSSERTLLEQFSQEADASDPGNGHAMAAYRIVQGFVDTLGTSSTEFAPLPIEQIQSVARTLFDRSGQGVIK